MYTGNSTTWLLQSLALVDSFYLFSCLGAQTLKALSELGEGEGVSWAGGGATIAEYFPYAELVIWPVAATGG